LLECYQNSPNFPSYKGKTVNFTLEQAAGGPEEEQSYSYTLSLISTPERVGGQNHALDALPLVPTV